MARRAKLAGSFAAALFLIFGLPAGGFAALNELEELGKRVHELEKKEADRVEADNGLSATLKKIAEKVTFEGLLEVEASVENSDVDGDSSDVTLATVAIGITAEVHKYVSGRVLFLWEENDTEPVDVDEAVIIISSPYGLGVTAGKLHLPFGAFNSHFISDPQTLELGETIDSAAMLWFEHKFFKLSGGAFNGDIDETGDDDINDFFGALTITPLEGFEFGGYYISDIAESELDMTGFAGGGSVMDETGGFGGYLSAAIGPVTIEGEYITAEERFDPLDLDVDADGDGDRPEAWNAEVAVQVHEKVEIAGRYEGNSELFGFPDEQYGAAVSFTPFEHVKIALEFLHGEFDAADGGGERDLGTLQLSLEY
jgi:hypothetical protein